MTKLEEIEQEIERLENKNCITYDIVHKLADLYTVRKYMKAGMDDTKMMDMKMTPSSSPLVAAPDLSITK